MFNSEVLMSGRRSHARFAVLRSPEGVLRVLRDIVIQSATPEQIVALSHEPGILGELVSVQLPAQASDLGPCGRGWNGVMRARVHESQPILVDGTVRHQLRLHHIDAAASSRRDAEHLLRGLGDE
jgi:hypothetical protein